MMGQTHLRPQVCGGLLNQMQSQSILCIRRSSIYHQLSSTFFWM